MWTYSLHSVIWDCVRDAIASDEDIQLILYLIENGMPHIRHELPHALRAFHRFREHLYTLDGVIIYKDRPVIQLSLQQNILSALHSAHQGTTSMLARAESSIFWPGITPAINATRANCEHGTLSDKRPTDTPNRAGIPFQCVCSDFFNYKGMTYLIIVDGYSNWPTVERTTGEAGA